MQPIKLALFAAIIRRPAVEHACVVDDQRLRPPERENELVGRIVDVIADRFDRTLRTGRDIEFDGLVDAKANAHTLAGAPEHRRLHGVTLAAHRHHRLEEIRQIVRVLAADIIVDPRTVDERRRAAVASVADGAGSARFSREGSRLACERAVESMTESVPKFFNEELDRAAINCTGGDEAANRQVRNVLYQVLCGAAFDAYKVIELLAGSGSHSIKDYATTLLLTACRRMAEGTLVATFWIGDGAIAVLQEGGRSATLMGRPDGGEFSGQTRFLTMPDILSDSHEMLRRIEFVLVKDLSAVMLMSDGVSDPKFGTDNRLLSAESWGGLWAEIQETIAPKESEVPEQRLLHWLDFWSAGEHDDRTLVVIRPAAHS